MKNRNGFVSNSSSSSFLISLARKPRTKQELKELLFHGSEFHLDYEDRGMEQSYDGDIVTTDRILSRIFADIRKAKPLTAEQIRKEFLSGSYEKVEKIVEEDLPLFFVDGKIDEEKKKEFHNRMMDYYTQVFIDDIEYRHLVYKLEYGNKKQGKLGLYIERGKVFRAIHHVRIEHS